MSELEKSCVREALVKSLALRIYENVLFILQFPKKGTKNNMWGGQKKD